MSTTPASTASSTPDGHGSFHRHPPDGRPIQDDVAPDCDYGAVFQASLTPQAVLTPSLEFVTVNKAFERASQSSLDDLVGMSFFDAFPGNQCVSDDDGPARLRASLERVVATGEPDHIVLQRYDVARPESPDVFDERWWSPVSSPIFAADGLLMGVLLRAEDVTGQRESLVKAMEWFRRAVDGTNDPERDHRFVEFMAAALEDRFATKSARQEVEQLKRALVSRADIDQAKGIMMATHRCDADTAFQLLAKMSNNDNTKLRDVVAAILYRTIQTRAS